MPGLRILNATHLSWYPLQRLAHKAQIDFHTLGAEAQGEEGQAAGESSSSDAAAAGNGKAEKEELAVDMLVSGKSGLLLPSPGLRCG
jgi:hypothetical protein